MTDVFEEILLQVLQHFEALIRILYISPPYVDFWNIFTGLELHEAKSLIVRRDC